MRADDEIGMGFFISVFGQVVGFQRSCIGQVSSALVTVDIFKSGGPISSIQNKY